MKKNTFLPILAGNGKLGSVGANSGEKNAGDGVGVPL